MNSKKALSFLHLSEGVPEGGSTRKKVLSEEDFVRLFVTERLLAKVALKQYPELSYHVIIASRKAYAKKYGEELRRVRSWHHALVMKGNTRGGKVNPEILLSHSDLAKRLQAGKSLRTISKELGTSEWFVRRNIQRYGLQKDGDLPLRMQHVDLEYLHLLENFSPGITKAAKEFYEKPTEFFQALYLALLRLEQMKWFILDQAKAQRYYRDNGTIVKDHTAWGTKSRAEIILALALLDAKIPHRREFYFCKKWRADFFFPEARLLVEVDGSIHQFTTKDQLRRRNDTARRLGYRMIHFLGEEVERNTQGVVGKIKALLP